MNAGHPPDAVYVAVCGGGAFESEACAAAEEVGRLLAERGAVVLTGGLGGVMDAASRGARAAGGLVVGVLPNPTREGANEHVDVALATGMGEMRNIVLVNACDVVIAIAGEYGTLSEIAFALRSGKPVVGLATWKLERRGERDAGIVEAASPSDAVDKAVALARA